MLYENREHKPVEENKPIIALVFFLQFLPHSPNSESLDFLEIYLLQTWKLLDGCGICGWEVSWNCAPIWKYNSIFNRYYISSFCFGENTISLESANSQQNIHIINILAEHPIPYSQFTLSLITRIPCYQLLNSGTSPKRSRDRSNITWHLSYHMISPAPNP